MGKRFNEGFVDPILIAIIVSCLVIGSLTVAFTKKNDTPVEQAAEAVLRTQGIDIDFSRDAEDSKPDNNKAAND